jgi:hypothetical protein
MPRFYKKGDKIMVLETGEIFTVFRDSGHPTKPAIRVAEMIGLVLRRSDVRAAGGTRQRDDLAKTIVEPDPPPGPPPDRLFF